MRSRLAGLNRVGKGGRPHRCFEGRNASIRCAHVEGRAGADTPFPQGPLSDTQTPDPPIGRPKPGYARRPCRRIRPRICGGPPFQPPGSNGTTGRQGRLQGVKLSENNNANNNVVKANGKIETVGGNARPSGICGRGRKPCKAIPRATSASQPASQREECLGIDDSIVPVLPERANAPFRTWFATCASSPARGLPGLPLAIAARDPDRAPLTNWLHAQLRGSPAGL